jgi:cytoskeletal protein RodZ
MNSIGDRLKEARETQNYTLEQVARDTRISKRFIQALEEEDFSSLPGETYLIGFLRNYSEYLGLPAEEIINRYKNIKLQEQPIPMEELIHGSRRKLPLVPIAVLVIIAVVLGGGGYFIYRVIRSRSTQDAETVPASRSEEFLFDQEVETRWFNQGDTILVAIGGERYNVRVASTEEDVSLEVPGGSVDIALSEARFIDLNLDSENDLRVVFNDADELEEGRRISLTLYRTASLMVDRQQAPEEDLRAAGTTAPGEAEDAQINEVSTAAAEADAAATADGTPAAGPPAATSVFSEDSFVILEADDPERFTLEINFRGNCLLRYQRDDGARDQRFFQREETFKLDDIGRKLVLWISNAGVLKAKVADREVSLGRAGQVVTKMIYWTKPEGSDQYRLEMVSLL